MANADVRCLFLVMVAERGNVLWENVWTDMQKWMWLPRGIFNGKLVCRVNLANSKISPATWNVVFVQEAMSH